ncbi:MAG: HD domain-containing protein [Bryobacterales bacterium]|nr:HD domain-containing protein [Bryobacterales bacterium]
MATKKVSSRSEDTEFRAPVVVILEPITERRQHLSECLSPEPFNVLCASTVVEAISLLVQQHVDLLLLPENLEDDNIGRLYEEIKILRMLRDFPVITVVELDHLQPGKASPAFPHEDFIEEPFTPVSVRSRVRRRLEARRSQESNDQTEAVLVTLAQTVEHRDRYTGGHCQRLSLYSVLLGSSLSLSQDELVALYRGGFLHDIGKIAIPDSVLLKEGPLTPEERILMQSHTVKGEEICRPMMSLSRVLPIIRSHHERWDGSGYPDGLVGAATPILARILQVADIFDAITTKRPYKSAQSPAEAMKILEGLAAGRELDSELVEAFLRIAGYPHLSSQAHQDRALLSQSLRNLRQVLTGTEANLRLLDLHQPRNSGGAAHPAIGSAR